MLWKGIKRDEATETTPGLAKTRSSCSCLAKVSPRFPLMFGGVGRVSKVSLVLKVM